MSKRKINSRFVGKKFGAWRVSGVKRSDKYMGKTSDSYAYTYRLVNDKTHHALTVSGSQMTKLANRETTISKVITGKKACLAKKVNVKANTIRSY